MHCTIRQHFLGAHLVRCIWLLKTLFRLKVLNKDFATLKGDWRSITREEYEARERAVETWEKHNEEFAAELKVRNYGI